MWSAGGFRHPAAGDPHLQLQVRPHLSGHIQHRALLKVRHLLSPPRPCADVGPLLLNLALISNTRGPVSGSRRTRRRYTILPFAFAAGKVEAAFLCEVD